MWDYDLNFHAENMPSLHTTFKANHKGHVIGTTQCLAYGAYRTWENVSMQNALKAVDKGVPIRRAAELYNVPRSTLHDRVSGKVMHGVWTSTIPFS